jgi:hypothetical protein
MFGTLLKKRGDSSNSSLGENGVSLIPPLEKGDTGGFSGEIGREIFPLRRARRYKGS